MIAELLLAPTDHHVEAALASRRGEGGGTARTLRTFVRESLARLEPGLRLATPAMTKLVTQEVLDRTGALGATASRMEEPASRVAFADAVDRAVGRLLRAGTPPARLRALGAPRATLLADVTEGATAMLARAGLVDERAAGGALATALARARGGALSSELDLGADRVVVTGALTWEGLDLAWLEALHAALARSGGGVRVELPRFGGEDDPTHSIGDALERRWGSQSDPPELAWSTAAVRVGGLVLDARDDEGEARAVARAVLDALARGTPPERIAILVPDLVDASLEPLRAALEEARVPFGEPRGRPATTSPEARAALGMLSIAAGPIARDTLIEVLRAPGLHAGAWTENADEREAARRATALAHRLRDVPVGVDRTGALFVDALALATQGHPHDAWMPRALARVLEDGARLRDAATLDDAARRVLELIEKLRLGRPSSGELTSALRAEERGEGALALGAMGDGTSALRAIRDATTAIRDAARELGLSARANSIAELALGIDRAAAAAGTARGGARRAGAVRIARPGELAGLSHEFVLVTRALAGAYGGEETLDAVLPDRLAAELPLPVRPMAGREREVIARAELAWALAGAGAVVLSRAAPSEEDLGPPHALVRDALAAGAAHRIEPGSRLSRGASRLSPRGAELAALAAGAPPGVELASRVAIERARAAFFLDPRMPAGAFTGGIALRDAEDRAHLAACVGGVAADRTIAVTAIERAAGCAFAGFAGRVLRVRRAEDAAEAADPRERGTLVHRALRGAFEAIAELPPGQPERALAAARAAAERAVELEATAAPLRREARLLAARDATRVVARALVDAEPIPFAAAERRFGAGELPPWRALELAGDEDDEEGSVFVDGQIDRVDATTDRRRARVVDYKTGTIPEARTRERTAFQLPLYAELVLRALGATEVEAMYLRVPQGGAIEASPKDPRERTLTAAERGDKVREARRVVIGLWRGEIAPRPFDGKLCARCDARDVCRRPDVAPIDDDAEEAT